MAYNLTAIAGNSTGVTGFFLSVNQNLTFGWLGLFLLIGVGMIAFISFIQATGDAYRSAAATAFIVFGLSMFFVAIGFISDAIFVMISVIAGLAVAASFKPS